MQKTTWDVVVVGGGAAGLSAALTLGRARRRVVVVDSGEQRNLSSAHVHGLLGQEGVAPGDLVSQAREQLSFYGVEFVEGSVRGVTDESGELRIALGRGDVLASRTLVAATGLTDELPDIPGLAERWGTSVLHCPYCHGWEVRDQHLGVLVTSDDGLHQAEMVRQWSSHVTAFTSGTGALDAGATRRLKARGIAIVDDVVTGVGSDSEGVPVMLAEEGELRVDALFTTTNLRPRDQFLSNLDLDRTETSHGPLITVDAAGSTSDPRIWAAGNVVNALSTVPVAIGEGATVGAAVNAALVEWDFEVAERESRNR